MKREKAHQHHNRYFHFRDHNSIYRKNNMVSAQKVNIF